jgi:hypothetical protein
MCTTDRSPGDVIAFSGTSCASRMIRCCTLGSVSQYQAAASAGELPSALRPGVSGGRELLEASE